MTYHYSSSFIVGLLYAQKPIALDLNRWCSCWIMSPRNSNWSRVWPVCSACTPPHAARSFIHCGSTSRRTSYRYGLRSWNTLLYVIVGSGWSDLDQFGSIPVSNIRHGSHPLCRYSGAAASLVEPARSNCHSPSYQLRSEWIDTEQDNVLWHRGRNWRPVEVVANQVSAGYG